jgi:hypothetical protein
VSSISRRIALFATAPGVTKGDIAAGLNSQPPDLKHASTRYTPSELFWILRHGIKMTGMPAWSDHSDEQLGATVAFVQELPGMSEQDYAKLVMASIAEGGHHRPDSAHNDAAHSGVVRQPHP